MVGTIQRTSITLNMNGLVISIERQKLLQQLKHNLFVDKQSVLNAVWKYNK